MSALKLSTSQSSALARARRATPIPVRALPPEGRTFRVLERAGLVTKVQLDPDLYALTTVGARLADELGLTWMKSAFLARELPEAIFIGDEAIAGPFCQHCGNPLSLHRADGLRCPDRIVHPAFPPPACTCHGVAA
jgi:hypothetical protein